MERIDLIMFDFGGVIADEGFRLGLYDIAEKNGLNPIGFEKEANALIKSTGYLTGKADERAFWDSLRALGVMGSDSELRHEILSRFTLRPWMIEIIERLKTKARLIILSDQTNWLDELNEATPFFHHFEKVFNSYYAHSDKGNVSWFADVLCETGVKPENALFIDDRQGNIERAKSVGINTIHFTGQKEFLKELSTYIS